MFDFQFLRFVFQLFQLLVLFPLLLETFQSFLSGSDGLNHFRVGLFQILQRVLGICVSAVYSFQLTGFEKEFILRQKVQMRQSFGNGGLQERIDFVPCRLVCPWETFWILLGPGQPQGCLLACSWWMKKNERECLALNLQNKNSWSPRLTKHPTYRSIPSYHAISPFRPLRTIWSHWNLHHWQSSAQ